MSIGIAILGAGIFATEGVYTIFDPQLSVPTKGLHQNIYQQSKAFSTFNSKQSIRGLRNQQKL
jgi:hypothetical protein